MTDDHANPEPGTEDVTTRMTLQKLRGTLKEERESSELQHIPDDYYHAVTEFLNDLKTRREEQAADVDDPFRDATVTRLTDEIETVKQDRDALINERIGKLVTKATLATNTNTGNSDTHTDTGTNTGDNGSERDYGAATPAETELLETVQQAVTNTQAALQHAGDSK
jgi:DNA replication initiation complex subunit (GINS family)